MEIGRHSLVPTRSVWGPKPKSQILSVAPCTCSSRSAVPDSSTSSTHVLYGGRPRESTRFRVNAQKSSPVAHEAPSSKQNVTAYRGIVVRLLGIGSRVNVIMLKKHETALRTLRLCQQLRPLPICSKQNVTAYRGIVVRLLGIGSRVNVIMLKKHETALRTLRLCQQLRPHHRSE